MKVHATLGERILRLAEHAAQTGEPIVRSMAYAYPDEGMEQVDIQFMLRDELLIAPYWRRALQPRRFICPTANGRAGTVRSMPAAR